MTTNQHDDRARASAAPTIGEQIAAEFSRDLTDAEQRRLAGMIDDRERQWRGVALHARDCLSIAVKVIRKGNANDTHAVVLERGKAHVDAALAASR